MQISPPKRSSLSRWEYAIPIKMNTFELYCGDSDSKALSPPLSLPFPSLLSNRHHPRRKTEREYGIRQNMDVTTNAFPRRIAFSKVYKENHSKFVGECHTLPPPLSLWHYWRRKGEETRSEEDVIFLLHLGAKLIPPPPPSEHNETKLWGMGEGRGEGFKSGSFSV